MLCLAQQVSCQIGRIGAVVSNDKDFARSGQHINIYMADNSLLR